MKRIIPRRHQVSGPRTDKIRPNVRFDPKASELLRCREMGAPGQSATLCPRSHVFNGDRCLMGGISSSSSTSASRFEILKQIPNEQILTSPHPILNSGATLNITPRASDKDVGPVSQTRKLIFIGGAEGSGTTVLLRLLSAPDGCVSLGGNFQKLPDHPRRRNRSPTYSWRLTVGYGTGNFHSRSTRKVAEIGVPQPIASWLLRHMRNCPFCLQAIIPFCDPPRPVHARPVGHFRPLSRLQDCADLPRPKGRDVFRPSA